MGYEWVAVCAAGLALASGCNTKSEYGPDLSGEEIRTLEAEIAAAKQKVAAASREDGKKLLAAIDTGVAPAAAACDVTGPYVNADHVEVVDRAELMSRPLGKFSLASTRLDWIKSDLTSPTADGDSRAFRKRIASQVEDPRLGTQRVDHVVIFVADELVAPERAGNDTFKAGKARGRAYVWSYEDGAISCVTKELTGGSSQVELVSMTQGGDLWSLMKRRLAEKVMAELRKATPANAAAKSKG